MRNLFNRYCGALLPLVIVTCVGPGARADALGDAAGTYRINKSSSINFKVDQAGGGGGIKGRPRIAERSTSTERTFRTLA